MVLERKKIGTKYGTKNETKYGTKHGTKYETKLKVFCFRFSGTKSLGLVNLALSMPLNIAENR